MHSDSYPRRAISHDDSAEHRPCGAAMTSAIGIPLLMASLRARFNACASMRNRASSDLVSASSWRV